MNHDQIRKNSYRILLGLFGLIAFSQVHAALLDDLTDAHGRYTGPTVEENVIAMDIDKNGFADVHEVRAFLELKHGKGYKKALLDVLEATAQRRSCTTSFVDELAVDSK